MRLTVITPSFNRPGFLDETIRSVVTQKGAFEIEYIVQDGGSDPAVTELLQRWKERIDSGEFKPGCRSLSFDWHAEADSGMYDAINRGFAKGGGDVFAWINSDDVFFPGAFDTVQHIFSGHEDIDWLVGRTACLNAAGGVIFTDRHQKAISRRFVQMGYYRTDLPFFNWLPQDSVFWRRSLWDQAGPLDTTSRLVSDFRLWQSFANFSEPVKVDSLLGAFRYHGRQLTGNPSAYRDELGPPPRLGIRLQLACGLAWSLPHVVNRYPAVMNVVRLLGLKKKDLLGRSCNWDFERSRWTVSERSVI